MIKSNATTEKILIFMSEYISALETEASNEVNFMKKLELRIKTDCMTELLIAVAKETDN